MKNRNYLFIALAMIIGLTSCKSEFERIRLSGDPKLMLSQANAYYADAAYQKAQTLYELVISSYRGKEEAEQIYYKYAYTYYYLEQYVLAAYYFKNFGSTYSASNLKEETEFMAAYCKYKLSPTFRLEQSFTEDAIEELQNYANTYPNSTRVGECTVLIDELRSKLERKAYEQAMLYYKMERYQAAIRSFENVLTDFPETDRAIEVRYLMAMAAYKYASNSFVEKQEARFKVAVEKLTEYKERYPQGENLDEIDKMLKNSQKKLKTLQDV